MSALEGNGGISAFIYPSGHGPWVKTGITRSSTPHDYKGGLDDSLFTQNMKNYPLTYITKYTPHRETL